MKDIACTAHSPGGFRIYSSLDPNSDFVSPASNNGEFGLPPAYTALQLLDVSHHPCVPGSRRDGLAYPDVTPVKYFALCLALGVRAVGNMVRGKLLALRWVECVHPEGAQSFPIWFGERETESLDDNALAEDKSPVSVVLPVSPMMGYAMRVVLAEFEFEAVVQENEQGVGDVIVEDERRAERERRESERV